MNRRPDPLDADERALAALLARDESPGPSPQLDARILAAARGPSHPTTTLRRPRPRWIAGMSIAATLVLAVGIAWRLRPLPERPVARTIPVAAVRVVEPRADAAGAAASEAVSAERQPQAQDLPRTIAAERESADARKPSPPAPPVAFDEPSPMETQAPAPPPPPAPTAAPAAAQAAMAAAPAANASGEMAKQARAQAPAETLDRIDAAAAADAAASGAALPSRALLDEEPPATADSPQVQEAWLQRIRDLLSAGDTDGARSSLAEFRRRYPDYALPEDLRRVARP